MLISAQTYSEELAKHPNGKVQEQLGIQESVWDYLWIYTQSRISFFKAFFKNELDTLLNCHFRVGGIIITMY